MKLRSVRAEKTGGLLASRSGQVAILLLLLLVALVFILLSHVDLHRVIQRKGQTQNAGDAAALAAARWQGGSLNLIGELNLMHVLALSVQNTTAVEAITNMQSRLCFTGPMTALFAAQLAAKQNRMYVDQGMSRLLAEHADTVATRYAATFESSAYYDEPWQGAWQQYSEMLGLLAQTGIAAGPDNARYFSDFESDHPLLLKAFYEAVEGEDWCWFHLFRRGLLESYTSFHSWSPLPDMDRGNYANAEIFGLGVRPVQLMLRHIFSAEELSARFYDTGMTPPDLAALNTNVLEQIESWFFYDDHIWTTWERIQPDGEDYFPVTGRVRPEYNLAGADAVVRVNASVTRAMPGSDQRENTVAWTAAAKPFGYLNGNYGSEPANSAIEFILPAFRNVRLIPVDAASGAENHSSDVEWVRHTRSHLHAYMELGPQARNCRYCRTLASWENPELRRGGIEWLETNSHLCRMRTTGGTRRGGGSRRGH